MSNASKRLEETIRDFGPADYTRTKQGDWTDAYKIHYWFRFNFGYSEDSNLFFELKVQKKYFLFGKKVLLWRFPDSKHRSDRWWWSTVGIVTQAMWEISQVDSILLEDRNG